MVDGGWWATFWFFKSLYNYVVYNSGIYMSYDVIPSLRKKSIFSFETEFFERQGALFYNYSVIFLVIFKLQR